MNYSLNELSRASDKKLYYGLLLKQEDAREHRLVDNGTPQRIAVNLWLGSFESRLFTTLNIKNCFEKYMFTQKLFIPSEIIFVLYIPGSKRMACLRRCPEMRVT